MKKNKKTKNKRISTQTTNTNLHPSECKCDGEKFYNPTLDCLMCSKCGLFKDK